MTIDLNLIQFTNDFYNVVLTNGALLKLNRVNEDFIQNSSEIEIKGINIEIITEDETETVPCSSVIGLTNEYFTIQTEHEQYIGKCLNEENMRFCIIETVENE